MAWWAGVVQVSTWQLLGLCSSGQVPAPVQGPQLAWSRLLALLGIQVFLPWQGRAGGDVTPRAT